MPNHAVSTCMDLHLLPDSTKQYTSGSQISKSLTEKWFAGNMYCPACPSDMLEQTPPNEKVVDFICPECEERYQLKGMTHGFRNKIVDSAYEPKIRMIRDGTVPNFVFLRFNVKELLVQDLMMVPKHFLVPEVIEKRKPLGPNARRAGWVGSNILLNRLPVDSRLYIIQNGKEIVRSLVHAEWKRFEFLGEQRIGSRGWLNDVLICIQELGKKEFTLDDVYAFEPRLKELHPGNKHIKEKIRQQLQILRDNGIIRFKRPGRYNIIN